MCFFEKKTCTFWPTVHKENIFFAQIGAGANIQSISSMPEKIWPNLKQNWGQERLLKKKGEKWPKKGQKITKNGV